MSSFTTLMGIIGLISSGLNPQIFINVAFLSVFFVHSLLSLYLQRSLLIPQIPLKESTPGGIRITGGIIIFFTALSIISGLIMLANADVLLEPLRERLAAENPEAFKEMNVSVLRLMGAILIIFPALYLINAILSFGFLKKWKQQQQELEDSRPEDDNLLL
ncbi:hypothetical protein [Chitinophaga sp. sic0106]|uniref:hypothetical protein n=1 Tax=Chitinophaga sp. sic0106 TaxID=2854785 RepID=UPI001C4838F9|nr:hypothetical protein [Chitinophaga sp. sic0106]MBV7531647.1 hypothetical protein [Chitinophaga sp. sic0106]